MSEDVCHQYLSKHDETVEKLTALFTAEAEGVRSRKT